MPRLLFHLSGKLPDDFVLNDDDYIYHSSILDGSRVHEKSLALPDPDGAFEKELCEKYIELFHNGTRTCELQPNIEFCFLNDYYSYSIRPVFSQMLAVKELCEKFPERDVVIFSAKTSCSLVPMLGFKTTESKIGSQDLLGSVTVEQIKKNKKFQSAQFISLRGDFFCNEFLRKNILRLANLVFSLLFIIKSSITKSHRGNKVDGAPVVIYRNAHQERFAMKLALSGRRLSLLYIPQLTQGKIRSLKKNNVVRGGVEKIGFNLMDILISLRKAFDLARDFRKNTKAESSFSILTVQGISIRLNKNWIKSEVSLVNIVFLYSALITHILKKNKVKKLVNFELVGRMAGIEAMCSSNLGIKVVSIQTALVASRPHPVFPYSTKFFADSEETARMIRGNGVIVRGTVEFAGSLERSKPLKIPKNFKRIVFYTQPYEPEATRRLISVLREWADSNNAELKIKIHPRDHTSAYTGLGLEDCYIDQNVNITELYDWADLTITRTSSVAKESLSLGCPVLLALWSKFDKKIKADYIDSRFSSGYISEDSESLNALLTDPLLIIRSNLNLRESLFSCLGPEELLNAIIND